MILLDFVSPFLPLKPRVGQADTQTPRYLNTGRREQEGGGGER